MLIYAISYSIKDSKTSLQATQILNIKNISRPISCVG